MEGTEFKYIVDRVDQQINYLEQLAMKYKRLYVNLKSTAIICNVLTTFTIALAFTVPESFRTWMGIIALVLSTLVLATYQWEEFHNYGAKWEKFRLVAERLKSEKFKFLNGSDLYKGLDSSAMQSVFVETVEKILRGTDISYFLLMVEPGKRVEKRFEDTGTE